MQYKKLTQLLSVYAKQHPDKPAVMFGDETITYAQLLKIANSFASYLLMHHMQGERIAFLLPNCLEGLYCYFACFKAGAIALPLNYGYAAPQVAYALKDAGAKWLIVEAEKLPLIKQLTLKETKLEKIFVVGKGDYPSYTNAKELFTASTLSLPEVSGNTHALIVYTSGSTGQPKGVVHTHESILGIMQSFLSVIPSIHADTKTLICQSINHIGAFSQLMAVMAVGGTLILEKEFNVPIFLSDLKKYQPDLLQMHVESIAQLVASKQLTQELMRCVKTLYTGGDFVPLALQREFLKETAIPIQVGWGMTESIILTLASTPSLQKLGDIGKPALYAEIEIKDEQNKTCGVGTVGEFWVKAPSNFLEYWHLPAVTQQFLINGFLRTGDCGYVDREGEYWFVGRKNLMIVRNTEKIPPALIENTLNLHPAVAMAAALGVPHAIEGETPIAFVVLHPTQKVTEAELIHFLRTQLTENAIPSQIYFIEKIPLTLSGKLDRKALLTLLR